MPKLKPYATVTMSGSRAKIDKELQVAEDYRGQHQPHAEAWLGPSA